MVGPTSRIALRYLAGFLLLKGIIPQELADQIAADPDLLALLGAGLTIAVEGFYFAAKKLGWRL